MVATWHFASTFHFWVDAGMAHDYGPLYSTTTLSYLPPNAQPTDAQPTTAQPAATSFSGRILERMLLVEAFSISRIGVFWATFSPALPIESGGLFGDYLKKLSLASTLRENDRETRPVSQSCPKEVSLKDRVKALEGLCDSVMILPKEIRSLKARDLKRPSRCIDKIYYNDYLEQFLITSGWRHCKFPWCTEIVVDSHLWDSLIGLDDKRLGWLVDDHIELWVWYMWHFRQPCDDWSMVSCYFLTLLLQDLMPLFYATNEIYPLAWRDVEQVFIPINEPKRHWSLAQFHIQSGNVTFYDSQKTYDVEYRSCKGIDPTSYSIKFTNAQNVPKQGSVFGDCGVFVCLFLYRLSHGIPLDVEDPIQAALAYLEKMLRKKTALLDVSSNVLTVSSNVVVVGSNVLAVSIL
ncbi:phospholipase-like protein [Tanacetum coccineum]